MKHIFLYFLFVIVLHSLLSSVVQASGYIRDEGITPPNVTQEPDDFSFAFTKQEKMRLKFGD